MTHAALAPGIGREFDPFLFASIGVGPHGHALSVISALAQLDFDPWVEAVGLARMSRELAAARLSRLIVSLPDAPASALPPDAIAAELVALLPRGRIAVPASRSAPSATKISETLRLGLGIGAIALMMALSLLFSTGIAPGPQQSVSPMSATEKSVARPSVGDFDRHP